MPPLDRSRATRPGRGSAAAALLLLGAMACTDSVAPAAREEPQDRIFFVSERDGATDAAGQPLGALYRMNVDGTGLKRLMVPARYSGLRLSPDGGWLAFHGDPENCPNIWAMRTSDTAATQLTGVMTYERCNYQPHWSPDGLLLAFISSRDPQRCWDAFVMRRDGSSVVNVSNNPATIADVARCNDHAHGWTPDGRVVLLSSREGSTRTYLVSPDGSGIEPVTALGDSVLPYWSPDGSRITFFRWSEGEVWVMSAAGGSALNLSNDPAHDSFSGWSTPWSPNGGRIAFTSNRTGDLDIWVVNADGTGLVNVTQDPGVDEFLQWLPDSDRILFTSNRSGDREVYTIRANGSGLRNLTNSPGVADHRAVWVPLK